MGLWETSSQKQEEVSKPTGPIPPCPPFDTSAYHWVEMKSDVLPENAFAAGKDVYVARAEIDGKFCVGKVHNTTRYCLGPTGYEERVTTEPFSVLCVDPKAELEWIGYDLNYEQILFSKKKLPSGIVSAGNDTIVGRGIPLQTANNELVPGLIVENCLECLYAGMKYSLFEFEVLVIKDIKK